MLMVRSSDSLAPAWSTKLHGTEEDHRHEVTIRVLTDDILLEIFALCIPDHYIELSMREWQRLVHVCQRWRQIIYASPRYLDLRLWCAQETSVKILSCWPELPIAIVYHLPCEDRWRDIIALLKHPDRIFLVDLSLGIEQFEEVAAAMQGPLPVLTELGLFVLVYRGLSPILPPGFLHGSVPYLRHILLAGLELSEFPKFLLSCDLVSLRFDKIHKASRISPKAMVAGLSVFTRLKTLYINFLCPATSSRFLIEQTTRHPDLLRAVLPALTKFEFGGISEYFEDLVAQLDAPQLDIIRMSFDHLYSLRLQLPHLSQFITRTENLRFRHAQVKFNARYVNISLD